MEGTSKDMPEGFLLYLGFQANSQQICFRGKLGLTCRKGTLPLFSSQMSAIITKLALYKLIVSKLRLLSALSPIREEFPGCRTVPPTTASLEQELETAV